MEIGKTVHLNNSQGRLRFFFFKSWPYRRLTLNDYHVMLSEKSFGKLQWSI